jgi:hypothetical protein
LRKKSKYNYTFEYIYDMTYSHLFFGKDIEHLSFEDIKNFFIEEKEESDKIEFKSQNEREPKQDGEANILRTICGLLNSDGGVIVWGAPAGIPNPTNKKIKIFKGELTLGNNKYEKDAFINVITNLITPSPNAIQFHRLEKEGKFIYIIEVAKSPYSPHQFKNTYLMRIDGQTVPAPHHYIEALFKRITFPRLEGFMEIISFTSEPIHQGAYMKLLFTANFHLFNLSELQNEHDISCKVFLGGANFLYSNSGFSGKKYLSKAHVELLETPKTLYFGEPYNFSEDITLTYLVSKKEVDMQIIFSFGGKTSPLKTCNYTILFNSQSQTYKIAIKQENNFLYNQEGFQKTYQRLSKSR